MNKLVPFVLLTGCAVGLDNSQHQLRTAIDAQQSRLHRCYSQALVNDAEMEGTMRLVVRVPQRTDRIDMVEPSGESQLTNPQLHGPLHRCVQRALVGTSIGATPMQDDLYVEYAFQFTPGNGSNLAFDPGPANQSVVDPNVSVTGTVTVDPRRGRGAVRGNVNVDANLGIR
jgi:hypothetical protein